MAIRSGHLDEQAKAVQEVAKATGKVVEAATKAGSFFSRYFEGPLEQVSGIVTDELRFRREQRMIRLHERAQQFLLERGITEPTRQVPLSFGIPLLQAGTLEEDDSLQDLWASLLANAADDSLQIEFRTAYISIIQSFSPLDAVVFNKFTDHPRGRLETLHRAVGVSKNAFLESITNLSRLGCVSAPMLDPATTQAIRSLEQAARASIQQREDPNRLGVSWASSDSRSERSRLDAAKEALGTVSLTVLGHALLTACRRAKPVDERG